LRDVEEKIRDLGAKLVVVGNGTPEQAADFQSEQNLAFPLLVDPEMNAYRAAGLKRGITDAVNLRMFRHGVRALRKGFRQARTQGDPWQLGGVFVITPTGEVPYRQISREAGDHPEAVEILNALEKLKAL
jgi:peroxiredoxin